MTIQRLLVEGVAMFCGSLVAIGAVAFAGVYGISAVGLTTGLAALGFGSMLRGIGTVSVIAIVTYSLTRDLLLWKN